MAGTCRHGLSYASWCEECAKESFGGKAGAAIKTVADIAQQVAAGVRKLERKGPAEILDDCAITYRNKHKEYGGNDAMFANAMAAFFPRGLMLDGFNDFYRVHIFILIMVKLSRYAANFSTGGHLDSVHDTVVYAAMLEAFDRSLKDDKEERAQCAVKE